MPRRQLIAAGYSDGQLRRLRASGAVTTVRRGAYVDSTDGRLADDVARHTLLVAAALADRSPGAVVSHGSAAVLYGLPVWAVPLDRVHVTRAQPSGGRIGRTVHLHTAPLDVDDLREVEGAIVTSPARTVVDVARTVSFEAGVAIADAALRAGLTDGESLVAVLRQATRWRGYPTARRVVAFADGSSESVGESRSRVALNRAGLPVPVPQWEVRRHGMLLGRVDFGWPELDTVGEFDGRIKYGRLLRPGQTPGDAVFEEKRREDALRDHGLRVVRWCWDDLDAFDAVAERLRHAFQRT
ncbi:MAG TPA: type IV toxin-antitoxin system AbiEi family antitoxin domain-containing protein [Pseudonocardia sp.]|jgi:predicted transcriptional regulator of viral defense system|nr:type IV toxin-antitoxin system AbiEi family antitoxin domain-containing protein [Pseudonocardia sp.]